MLPEKFADLVAAHEAYYGVVRHGALDMSEKGIDGAMFPRAIAVEVTQAGKTKKQMPSTETRWIEERDVKTGTYRLVMKPKR